MKKSVAVMACLAVLGVITDAGAVDVPPDLILLHGRIHTQDSSRSVAQALAVRGNTIVAVGTDPAISSMPGPNTIIIDLADRVMLPGLIDAHIHLVESAQNLGKCSLEDKGISPAELKAKLGLCLQQNPGDPKQWFEAVQINASGLTLTRGDLDSILSERPMILYSADGHTVWENSAALKATQFSAATKDPVGGRIERDAAGNPTGTLRDTAADMAGSTVPPRSLDFMASQLEHAFDAMHATGITSVQDASVDERDMQIYKYLYDAHRLKMRVRASFTLKNLRAPAKIQIDRAIRFRSKWAIDPDFLRADAIKIFSDGVIEYPSQTAALLEPYLDADGHPTQNRGPTYVAQAQFDRIVSAADAAGFTVHVHAIGDRAVRSTLDAFAASRRSNGMLDNRDQIAHLELISPTDFPRFKELGVIANFQLLWATLDPTYIVKNTLPYIGPERSKYLYPARSLRDAGALIAGGSDWDVSSFDPFAAMERAITRSEGRGQGSLLPEQSITLQDIVDAYTINAAYALKQEHTTGSLEPGKRGDFIVLDKDIFAIDPFDLHDTHVLMTYLDGHDVYAAKTR
jgi:predicted amidohydrolase YtcJ